MRLPGGDHAALPRRIDGELEDLDRGLFVVLAIDVDDDARPGVREMFVKAIDGGTIDDAVLRGGLPLPTYCKAILERVLWTVEESSPGSYRVTPVVGDRSKRVLLGSKRRKNQPVDDERLERIARLYREAVADPNVRSPALFIKAAENIAPSTAKTLIGLARKRGFLGPALGTKPGEEGR